MGMSTWTPSGGVSAGGVLFLQILIGSTAAYVVATTLYSLTVHPLSDIPGPKGCAVSRIPWWVACLTGNQVRFMVGLHKRYGPVVRFGPNDVSYADDGQAWRDLYGYEKSRPENPKDEVFHAPPANGVPNIITANLRDHARVRKVFAPAFSARALKQQQPLFTKYVDLLVAQLGKKEDADESGWSKTPKDLCMMFNLTTFDIMGELTFGQPLGLLKNARYTPWVQSIFKSLKILPVVQIIEFYAPLKFIYRLIEPQSVKNMRHDHWNHSASRVDKRLEQGSEQPDIWNLAINAETDGAKLVTLAEMHSNAELFMTAGTETSASVLSGLSFFLMANPTKLKLLTEEVRSHFASDADIDLDGLVALPYLNACIREGLRIYPPVPSTVPRRIAPGGNRVLGRWLPGGTSASVHQLSTFRSPANFRDPDTFAPERWLPAKETGSEKSADGYYASDKRDAHQPFSVGPRNCIGVNMAWHEMRLILAKMVYNLDLELANGQEEWSDQNVYVVWERKPLLCRFKRAGPDI